MATIPFNSAKHFKVDDAYIEEQPLHLIDSLPTELHIYILNLIDLEDAGSIGRMAQTCRYFRNLVLTTPSLALVKELFLASKFQLPIPRLPLPVQILLNFRSSKDSLASSKLLKNLEQNKDHQTYYGLFHYALYYLKRGDLQEGGRLYRAAEESFTKNNRIPMIASMNKNNRLHINALTAKKQCEQLLPIPTP